MFVFEYMSYHETSSLKSQNRKQKPNLGQVWYLIVSIPDLCTLTYFNYFIQSTISIEISERIITLCNSGTVGDEFNYVMECCFFDFDRKIVLPHINKKTVTCNCITCSKIYLMILTSGN